MNLGKKAKQIRDLIIDVAWKNQSHHVGSNLSCVEILTYLKYSLMEPGDLFILSKGHAALAWYAILHDTGVITKDELYDYQKVFGEHMPYLPERDMPFATGSLGHGVAAAVGFALANPKRKVYVLCGDGETEEGSFYEALGLKRELDLTNMTVIVDNNGFQGFKESPRRTVSYDGHSFPAIESAFESNPEVIWFDTIKGKGVSEFENKLGSHYWTITKEDL